MKRIIFVCVAFFCVFLLSPVYASTVNVDLSGATSGTNIIAPGAQFTGIFDGQTNNGTTVSGSPDDPLTLIESNFLTVAFWNGTNSIIPEPGNQGPLSILLDSEADSISWRMGSAGSTDPITIDFFDNSGALVHSLSQALLLSYNDYNFFGFGAFSGLTISDNVDPAGLRFQNFSYNSTGDAVPIPGAVWLFSSGLLGLVGIRKKLKG